MHLKYVHKSCLSKTSIAFTQAQAIEQAPAQHPRIWCECCKKKFPLKDFHWEDGSGIGVPPGTGDRVEEFAEMIGA